MHAAAPHIMFSIAACFIKENINFLMIPGVAGQGCAHNRVEHSNGDVTPVEEAVPPLVRENIG